MRLRTSVRLSTRESSGAQGDQCYERMRFWPKALPTPTYILAMSGGIDDEPVAIGVADVKEADIKT